MGPQSSTAKRCLAVLGRLVLILCVWHAPLPVLHAHGTDVDDSPAGAAMIDHLVGYHPGATANSNLDFGWHWHLVPPPCSHPCDDSTDGDCPFCPCDNHETLPQSEVTVGSPLVVVVWATPLTMDANTLAGDVNMRAAHHSQTRYLDTYLGSVPLGTLLRVARC